MLQFGELFLPNVALPYLPIYDILTYFIENGGWEAIMYEVENDEHRADAYNHPDNAPPLPTFTGLVAVVGVEITEQDAHRMVLETEPDEAFYPMPSEPQMAAHAPMVPGQPGVETNVVVGALSMATGAGVTTSPASPVLLISPLVLSSDHVDNIDACNPSLREDGSDTSVRTACNDDDEDASSPCQEGFEPNEVDAAIGLTALQNSQTESPVTIIPVGISNESDNDGPQPHKQQRTGLVINNPPHRITVPPTYWEEHKGELIPTEIALGGGLTTILWSGTSEEHTELFLVTDSIPKVVNHTSWIRKASVPKGFIGPLGPVEWECVEVRNSPHHGNRLGVWNKPGHVASFGGTGKKRTKAVVIYGGNRFHDLTVLDDPNFDASYCCESGYHHAGWQILDAHPRLLVEAGGRPHSWIGSLINQANTVDEINCEIAILSNEQLKKMPRFTGLNIAAEAYVCVELLAPIGSEEQWLTDYKWDHSVQLKYRCGLWYHQTYMAGTPWTEELPRGTLVRNSSPEKLSNRIIQRDNRGNIHNFPVVITPDTLQRYREQLDQINVIVSATSPSITVTPVTDAHAGVTEEVVGDTSDDVPVASTSVSGTTVVGTPTSAFLMDALVGTDDVAK